MTRDQRLAQQTLSDEFPFVFDRRENVLTIEPRWFERIGRPFQKALPLATLIDWLVPGDREFFSFFFTPFRDGVLQRAFHDLQVACGQGVPRVMRTRMVVPVAGTGEPLVVFGLFQDVTETKKTMTDLSDAERRFMEILEESPHALYRVNYRENKFDYVSKGFAKTLGLSREEVLSRPYTEFFTRCHPEDVARIFEIREEKLATWKGGKLTYYLEFRLRKADGTYVWVSDSITLVPDELGFAYSVGFGADINDRKLLEEELTAAKASLETQVRKRTAELRASNRQLKAEIERRKRIEEDLLRIEEREKAQLGRELHDDIGQRLNSLRFFQEGLSEKFGGVLGTPAGPMALRPKRRAKEPCDSVSPSEDWQRFCTLVDGTQSALRSLSHRLCAVDLNAHTFAAKVEEFLAEIGRTFRVGTHLALQPDVRPLDQEAACHLFRILQESVANGLKHGKPKNLFVTFQGKKGKGEFAIRNDGQDFPGTGAIRTGIGLHSMETRCRLLGGTLFLGRPATGGMLVRCRIPVRANPESET